MLIFVDEAGDAGWKLEQGSSLWFTLALAAFETARDAQACDRRIDRARVEMGLPEGYEFRLAANPRRVREGFLRAVAGCAFRYQVFTVDKARARHALEPGQRTLYEKAIGLALSRTPWPLEGATVVIDQRGERRFRNELAAHLRSGLRRTDGGRAVRKVKQQRSGGNNLLQLADYLAGLHHGRSELAGWRGELRRLVATRCVAFDIWPDSPQNKAGS